MNSIPAYFGGLHIFKHQCFPSKVTLSALVPDNLTACGARKDALCTFLSESLLEHLQPFGIVHLANEGVC